MNKLKSLFIGVYPVVAMGITGYAFIYMYRHGFDPGWFGALLTTLPVMMFFSRAMILRDMARTTPHFPLITLLAVVGVGLTVANAILYAPSFMTESHSLIATAIGFIGYMVYNYWYSALDRPESELLKKGGTIPSFTMTDGEGETFSSESLAGNPAILLFYRGNWCPLCMAQIKEIAAQYREIGELGASVLLISPQPQKNTEALAQRFDVPFTFLTDKGNGVARKLGIEMKDGLPMGMEMLGYDKDTVLPTVIIIDENGKIIHIDETDNYRIRPEPEEYLKVLNPLYS